jgi:outer membrane usher protein
VRLKAKKSLIKIFIATLFLLASVNFEWLNAATAAESEKTFLTNKNVNVPEKLFLSVEVNSQTVNGIFYAEQFTDGRLILAEDAWVASNLTLSGTKVLMANSQFGLDINRLQGIRYVLDSRTQSIKINAQGKSFGLTNLSKNTSSAELANNSPPGAYLNYNLTSAATSGEQDSKSYGAFIEGIVFNQYGSLVYSVVSSFANEQSKSIRAETYFQKDMPSSMQKLIIGDTISSAGAWSRPIRFGGVLWSTDFSLKQGFISAMTPSIQVHFRLTTFRL